MLISSEAIKDLGNNYYPPLSIFNFLTKAKLLVDPP